jgi:hypothetical protein
MKRLKTTWWGLMILTVLYLVSIGAFTEYLVNREVSQLIVMVCTLGAVVCTYQLLKLINNFILTNLKEKKND